MMDDKKTNDIVLINKSKHVTVNLTSRTATFQLSANGKTQTVRLGSREIETIRFLLNNQGRIVSRDEIQASVWGERIVCENTVSVTLSNIRKIFKKADEDCSCLINISNSGYVFRPEKSGFLVEQQR